jgi:predicted DNA-binding transcriptional regulator YafY
MGTSARTLQLLSLLQGRRYWSGAALAQRLEVSLRTLRRDVELLRELGYPVQAHRGVDGGYQLAPGAVLPPLLLDDEEAVALAVGLQAATTSDVTGMAESALRALAKVVQVMPPGLRTRVDALRAMTVMGAPGAAGTGTEVDPAVLTTTAQACRDDERLVLAYTAADGAASERTVEPYRLVSLGRRWYLVAYDLDRHDWRSFRLDRMRDVRREGSRFRQRTLPAEDAATFVRQGMRSLPASYQVSAVVHAPAAQVQPRLGRWATAEPIDDGSCRVSMRADNLDWAAFTLAVAAADVTDVSPPELREHLQRWVRHLTAGGP